jgi:hypothetical protein
MIIELDMREASIRGREKEISKDDEIIAKK